MDLDDPIPLLEAIIRRERAAGCPMASPSLIESAPRRWRSYERRNRHNKDKTFDHRVLDLTKGLLALFPEHGYDKSCLTHLAESFVAALSRDAEAVPPTSCHESSTS